MEHVCPWWMTYLFDNPIRRLIHDPRRMMEKFVRPGMRVADIGCGMGCFTVALAELAGPPGQVQAVDLQEQQLRAVGRRCRRGGVSDRVKLVRAGEDRLGLEGPLDFVLAFWMVHEVPDQGRFFGEILSALGSGGRLLVAEPKFHVTRRDTEVELSLARSRGIEGRMTEGAVRLSWSFVVEKK
ncbi:MAG: methyltransferase domain-containing protein [Deltaproteobacteria bacterium]|nr:methyltransferase domain-containing protein [Deltaproteobacteria bacterium]